MPATAADCIVMGTQGLSGYKKMFLGSVTEHVLRRSRVPVLAVPPGEPDAGTDGLEKRIGRVMAPVASAIAPSTTSAWRSN